MKKVISSEKKPIKMWLDDIEEGALEQAKNLANLPFLYKWVAIMPDSHQGFGMPIGGVIATENVIIPNAVGSDIGCGMSCLPTSLTTEDLTKENIKRILGGSKEYHGGIRSNIPVGFKHRSKKVPVETMPEIETRDECPIAYDLFEEARNQLGTLGGGK